jgi:hypothetical protein
MEETPEPIAATVPAEEVFSLAAASMSVLPMPPRVESQGDVPVEIRGEDILMRQGEREYRSLARSHWLRGLLASR